MTAPRVDIVLQTFTTVDFWTLGRPHAYRVTIVQRVWPADVSKERH